MNTPKLFTVAQAINTQNSGGPGGDFLDHFGLFGAHLEASKQDFSQFWTILPISAAKMGLTLI